MRSLGSLRNSILIILPVLFLSCGEQSEDFLVGDVEMKKVLAVIPAGARNVSVAKGSLNGDANDEFVVSYEDSIKGTVIAIMDSSYITRFELGTATDQAAALRLEDVDGDSILDVVFSGPASGGESLQVIRSSGGSYSLVADFWGLRVRLFDEENDGLLEVEVENRDFDRDPNRHTVHTFYRWEGKGFAPFRSYKASQRFIF
jgi:hypothetical protein